MTALLEHQHRLQSTATWTGRRVCAGSDAHSFRTAGCACRCTPLRCAVRCAVCGVVCSCTQSGAVKRAAAPGQSVHTAALGRQLAGQSATNMQHTAHLSASQLPPHHLKQSHQSRAVLQGGCSSTRPISLTRGTAGVVCKAEA